MIGLHLWYLVCLLWDHYCGGGLKRTDAACLHRCVLADVCNYTSETIKFVD